MEGGVQVSLLGVSFWEGREGEGGRGGTRTWGIEGTRREVVWRSERRVRVETVERRIFSGVDFCLVVDLERDGGRERMRREGRRVRRCILVCGGLGKFSMPYLIFGEELIILCSFCMDPWERAMRLQKDVSS